MGSDLIVQILRPQLWLETALSAVGALGVVVGVEIPNSVAVSFVGTVAAVGISITGWALVLLWRISADVAVLKSQVTEHDVRMEKAGI